jgi:hypothetical protein
MIVQTVYGEESVVDLCFSAQDDEFGGEGQDVRYMERGSQEYDVTHKFEEWCMGDQLPYCCHPRTKAEFPTKDQRAKFATCTNFPTLNDENRRLLFYTVDAAKQALRVKDGEQLVVKYRWKKTTLS